MLEDDSLTVVNAPSMCVIHGQNKLRNAHLEAPLSCVPYLSLMDYTSFQSLVQVVQ